LEICIRVDNDLKEYNLDTYDDSTDEEAEEAQSMFFILIFFYSLKKL